MNRSMDVEQRTNVDFAVSSTSKSGFAPCDHELQHGNYGTDVLFIPAQTTDLLKVKQGGKCCGCCCDCRRATLVVDILVLVFNILAILSLSHAGITAWKKNLAITRIRTTAC